jgi:hypothetical protein
MVDIGILSTIAAVIAGFGIAGFVFRIQRELAMQDAGENTWVPWADWLLIGATIGTLVLVLVPILLFNSSKFLGRRLPAAGCSAALVSLAGYIPGLLAHYRLVFGASRSGSRTNPEPAERVVVITSGALSVVAFVASLVSTA